MILLKQEKSDKSFLAFVNIPIRIYVTNVDNEISEEEALRLTLRELESLAGSNDGSELLANIKAKQIFFNG